MSRLIAVVLAALGCICIALASDEPRLTPILLTLTPDTAKAGDIVVATGNTLGKSAVGSLYLSKGEVLVKVAIVKQDEESISFKVPDEIKPGRFGLTVLTLGLNPIYVDEPVVLTVE
jgi:hypothetical protein